MPGNQCAGNGQAGGHALLEGMYCSFAVVPGNINPFAWSLLAGIGGTVGLFGGRDLDR